MTRAGWTVALAALCLAAPAAAAEETFSFGRFGTVTLYRTSPTPPRVALFVSGDGGWNSGVVDMAQELAKSDTLVVGVDIRAYFRSLESSTEACSYPAADFEALSKAVQQKLGYPQYVLPVLVGYSSGATLVYATVVQSPPNTFRGALSMGFCPDLPLTKPFCKGAGLAWDTLPKGKGVSFLPAAELKTPWVCFQGLADQVCDPPSTVAFAQKVRGAQLVTLPKVGHGFSVTKNWLPQFQQAFAHLADFREPAPAAAPPVDLKDLPLIEVPAAAGAPSSDVLTVLYSGDGGWAGLDKDVAAILAARGIPVVGVSSLQYFWTPRTPEGAARDLERILRAYLARWNKERVILMGYSLGADVMPFLASRLPQDLRVRVRAVALVGLSETAVFEFHVSEWLGGSKAKQYPVKPELAGLKGLKVLCFCGEQESDSACKGVDPALAAEVRLAGGHHFGGKYDPIADRILQELEAGPGVVKE